MLLFPHENIRPAQQDFIEEVTKAITEGTDLLIHAPTGLGKTAASLAPALTEAIDSKKTIFFLTSRHTQHEIAIKTLEDIKNRHQKTFQAVDIIGKKWMCSQPNVQRLPSGEFTEFCRAMREDGKCEYYTKLKKGEKTTVAGDLAISALQERSPVRNQAIIETAQEYKICPYYTSMELTKKAKVIIGDYYYIFHPKIREGLFAKSNNELENAIIIVDEAHNLPNRIKDLASARLSNIILKRGISEAQKKGLHEIANQLSIILETFEKYQKKVRNEQTTEISITREQFVMDILRAGNYDELREELINTGDAIREEAQVSYIGAVGNFLEEWQGDDSGYTRIFSLKKGLREEVAQLSYRCLDASIITKPIIEQAHSTIFMSGTFTPTTMYKELLGAQDAVTKEYPSPFPNKNKRNIIIPQTSTKYSARSEEQYKNIADILAKTVAKIPGNVAIFLPSYFLLQEVNKYFQTNTEKTVFTEQPHMNTEEKETFINNFRQYKKTGAVLVGVISGNFGEGIDLPGDELKGVIIVGLPLQKPDLESEALIKYYDDKYNKGWDYGYLFPAFNRTLQSAGRCIRSENDRGVIIFLDERYAWPNYKRCFPKEWKIEITLLYEKMIENFFAKN